MHTSGDSTQYLGGFKWPSLLSFKLDVCKLCGCPAQWINYRKECLHAMLAMTAETMVYHKSAQSRDTHLYTLVHWIAPCHNGSLLRKSHLRALCKPPILFNLPKVFEMPSYFVQTPLINLYGKNTVPCHDSDVYWTNFEITFPMACMYAHASINGLRHLAHDTKQFIQIKLLIGLIGLWYHVPWIRLVHGNGVKSNLWLIITKNHLVMILNNSRVNSGVYYVQADRNELWFKHA